MRFLDTIVPDSVSTFVPDAVLPPPSMVAYLVPPWTRALRTTMEGGQKTAPAFSAFLPSVAVKMRILQEQKSAAI